MGQGYLGIATANVDFGGNVDIGDPEIENVDMVVPDDIRQFIGTRGGSPRDIEFAQDASGNFGIAHLAKKFHQVCNVMSGAKMPENLPTMKAEWHATNNKPPWLDDWLSNSDQAFLAPGNDYPSDYVGPRWQNVYTTKQIPTLDDSNISVGNNQGSSTGSPSSSPAPSTRQKAKRSQNTRAPATSPSPSSATSPAAQSANDDVSENYSTGIHQYQATRGIWWGASVDTGAEVGAGLWLDIARSGIAAIANQPSFILVALNTQNSGNGPDFGISLWLEDNQKPKILDYASGIYEDMENAAIINPGTGFRIGLLPLCGRLIVNINGSEYVYTKRNKTVSKAEDNKAGADTFDFRPFAYQIKDIYVFGSNCQAILSLGAMTFSTGEIYIPLGEFENWTWPDDMMTRNQEDPKTIYGASSKDHTGAGDDVRDANFPNPKGKLELEYFSDHCIVRFEPDDIDIFGGSVKGGTPGLHRICSLVNADNRGKSFVSIQNGGAKSKKTLLKGVSRGVSRGASRTRTRARGSSSDVLGVQLNFQAPDYYHAQQSAEITLYNEGGRNDDLLDSSVGVSVGLGWGGNSGTLFTGVTVGGYRSETAGMETIVVNCQDYMFILDSAKMLNSPYYDGKDAFQAVAHIARMAGINPVDDTGSDGWALPCGYSFTKPAMKFNKGRSLKDCIIEIAKLAECLVYFDEQGQMHYGGIQGGIAFEGNMTSSATFNKNPGNKETSIIDEYRVGHKLEDAVNIMYIETVDRTSNGVCFFKKEAGSQNLFPFPKPIFIPQAALGSAEDAVAWGAMLSHRLFKAPKTTTVKTVSDTKIVPMSVISVEGQQYRVLSVQRSYSANDNSLITTLSGEWYG